MSGSMFDEEYWQGRNGLPYTGGDLVSYELGKAHRGTSDGGGGGSDYRSLLLLAGVVVAVPAAAMALPATPLLKLAAVGTGAHRWLPWRGALLVCVVGSMWYLALTAGLFAGLDAFVRRGLIFDPFAGGIVWQQWLVVAWWSGVALTEGFAALWSADLGGVLFGRVRSAPAPLPMVVAAAAMLHLPGLVAYAMTLRRARVTPAGAAGFAVALSLAVLLVGVSLPIAVGVWAVVVKAVVQVFA